MHTAFSGKGPLAAALLFIAAALLLPACTSIDRSVSIAEMVVLPITVGEAREVSADDLAEAMLKAGFTAEEVVRHGPALHNALATSGGAQTRQGGVVAAVFAIHSDELYVVSRTRGTFLHKLDDWNDPAEAQ